MLWGMSSTASAAQSASPAHLGWRLLALVYDALPVLALWMLTSLLFYLAHGLRPIESGSLGGWIELVALWAVTGLYAVESWARGGQTLGMRAWRLKVLSADGAVASRRALWLRYAVATLSLAAAGVGFLWSLIERERRTWHDRASRTAFVRIDKPRK